MASSPCFTSLPGDWTNMVRVLDGDLATSGFGTAPADVLQLATVTHLVHSAAAVSFTLPGAVAAKANISTSLNLLAASRACPSLERIVYVSTAYVSPHRAGKIPEVLVPLPMSATELLSALENGTMKDADVLARTGHPNTYTLTKTIAEHIMSERRGSVPLTIVRPSIISASRHQPMPGWIDSNTGFGAFVTLIGLGHLRAVVGRPDAQLDLVPVDEVASCVLDAMIETAPGVTVRHSVAGVKRAPTVHECWDEIERHFQQNPVQRRPSRRYLGPRDSAFFAAPSHADGISSGGFATPSPASEEAGVAHGVSQRSVSVFHVAHIRFRCHVSRDRCVRSTSVRCECVSWRITSPVVTTR
jgi:fatty acyl-CoA reductase